MGLYAEALRDLGRFLGERRALDLVAEAGGSADRLASILASGMSFFDDVGFWKRGRVTLQGDVQRTLRNFPRDYELAFYRDRRSLIAQLSVEF